MIIKISKKFAVTRIWRQDLLFSEQMQVLYRQSITVSFKNYDGWINMVCLFFTHCEHVRFYTYLESWIFYTYAYNAGTNVYDVTIFWVPLASQSFQTEMPHTALKCYAKKSPVIFNSSSTPQQKFPPLDEYARGKCTDNASIVTQVRLLLLASMRAGQTMGLMSFCYIAN